MIKNVQDSKQKTKEIEKKLELERINISNNRYDKEKQEQLLNNANFILDSLNSNLIIVRDNKKSVSKILDDINQNQKMINYKITVLNDSIKNINQTMIQTKSQLNNLKNITKKLVKEIKA